MEGGIYFILFKASKYKQEEISEIMNHRKALNSKESCYYYDQLNAKVHISGRWRHGREDSLGIPIVKMVSFLSFLHNWFLWILKYHFNLNLEGPVMARNRLIAMIERWIGKNYNFALCLRYRLEVIALGPWLWTRQIWLKHKVKYFFL